MDRRVLGHGDSVLLDGCRIGCGARVRRAVVGAGAVVDAEAAIGYGTPLARLAGVAPDR
jgi:carbonic anhydrase/acetyltransferase-like protein (isoleucine patch superfamily)